MPGPFHRNNSSVHSILEHPAGHRSTVARPEHNVCKDRQKGAGGGLTERTVEQKDDPLMGFNVLEDLKG